MTNKRPEEFIVDITDKLKQDLCKLAKGIRRDTLNNLYHPPTDAEIEADVVELTVAVSKGLKSLVKYTKEYAVDKHIQETKDE